MILTQNVSKTTSVGDGRTLLSSPLVRRQQQVLGLAACVATSWWAALEDDADEKGGAGLGVCESMRGSQKMTNKWHVRKGGRTGRSG